MLRITSERIIVLMLGVTNTANADEVIMKSSRPLQMSVSDCGEFHIDVVGSAYAIKFVPKAQGCTSFEFMAQTVKKGLLRVSILHILSELMDFGVIKRAAYESASSVVQKNKPLF